MYFFSFPSTAFSPPPPRRHNEGGERRLFPSPRPHIQRRKNYLPLFHALINTSIFPTPFSDHDSVAHSPAARHPPVPEVVGVAAVEVGPAHVVPAVVVVGRDADLGGAAGEGPSLAATESELKMSFCCALNMYLLESFGAVSAGPAGHVVGLAAGAVEALGRGVPVNLANKYSTNIAEKRQITIVSFTLVRLACPPSGRRCLPGKGFLARCSCFRSHCRESI